MKTYFLNDTIKFCLPHSDWSTGRPITRLYSFTPFITIEGNTLKAVIFEQMSIKSRNFGK